ncbi:His-Xaa-Ser system radical SAM maturase HxsB [Pseudodonghicola xiamenensis]|uniref:His-Xaa-Ser system radical SAM maturase HxsB n=2 Tax=Pseudodonghicola xiamenensis TaxID=337702 RepID=A0A8J3MCZ4_9RHOB|nr:His-Xaa-Ser system radical SAM maturase HxsB [Pseudodonghicola xiamenensis]
MADRAFVDRYARDELNRFDTDFLVEMGQAFRHVGELPHTAFLTRWAQRQHVGGGSAYVILIPTLRCDLKCSYCQVSRAPVAAKGFDWDDETLAQVLTFLDALPVDEIQIEFQGGEPLLRLDHLKTVTEFARRRFQRVRFVVCTNLQTLDADILAFLANEDVLISTSLDGPHQLHTRNRTGTAELTQAFHRNLAQALDLIGPSRVSALPTIDMECPPKPEDLIAAYEDFGFTSLYLRPVNYQGFARKSHPSARTSQSWTAYYRNFVYTLISHNARTGRTMEEFYLAHCLRRILAPGADSHTDLRNPNIPTGTNAVIDFDGQIYPSDEARMLARIRQVDLSVGDVANGLDHEKLALIAPSHINNFDPDCIHCPYQPFCGTDPIDDLSRNGRIDIPRHESWFCQRHLAVFDLAVELLYSEDPAVDFSLCHWLGLETLPDALRPAIS